jgi:hypothetical protein
MGPIRVSEFWTPGVGSALPLTEALAKSSPRRNFPYAVPDLNMENAGILHEMAHFVPRSELMLGQQRGDKHD